MAYWNGTQLVYETFDYMLQAQTAALHGSPSNVGNVPAAYKAAYTEGFTYGSNEMRVHTKRHQA
jgi:hypothetical protein